MLQIISGKFFASADCHVTRQRAVLYTNYRTHSDVETIAGALRTSESASEVASLVYEVDQRIEKGAEGGFALVATAPDELINDFAALVSFVLDVTCTPDLELTRRLTQAKRGGLGISLPPQRFIARTFDQRVEFTPGDTEKLIERTKSLISLDRKSYEAAIRAIRRYVTGLHRISDDLDLAYTLLVASMESLAQGFDQFTPTWMDVPQDKRARIDKALEEVPPDASDRVRETLIHGEHLALARRFREFVLSQLQPEFFRSDARGRSNAVRRSELSVALLRAYRFRSSYVHTLQSLPRQLTSFAWEGETFLVDGKPALTFRGLARVARAAIEQFVRQAPRVEKEQFNWRAVLPGIVRLDVSTRYWIWQPEGFNKDTARAYLNGLLAEIAATLADPSAQVTDMRGVLEKIEKMAPGMSRKNRRTMLAVYILFHGHVSEQCGRPNAREFAEQFKGEFDEASIESLVLHVLLDGTLEWTLAELTALWDEYYEQRFHKNGLRLPNLLEAAASLWIAEAYRTSGDASSASRYVTAAVEDMPGDAALEVLENEVAENPDRRIDWRAVLIPRKPVVEAPPDGEDAVAEGASSGSAENGAAESVRDGSPDPADKSQERASEGDGEERSARLTS